MVEPAIELRCHGLVEIYVRLVECHYIRGSVARWDIEDEEVSSTAGMQVVDEIEVALQDTRERSEGVRKLVREVDTSNSAIRQPMLLIRP